MRAIGRRSFLAAACAPLAACAPPVQPSSLGACPLFPPGNVWNTPINTLPLDRRSADYVASIGVDRPLHPDFGHGGIGIPFVDVPGTQPRVAVRFHYDGESDAGPYPIPPDAPVEGGPNGRGDRHVLVLDRDQCRLYEIYDAHPRPDGTWAAQCGAAFSLRSHDLRPDGWTSADAAGLPILPGLVRYDEVATGVVRHAIRFTAPRTQRAYVWPARHQASPHTDPRLPPLGQRFRLRADYDLAGFSAAPRAVLRALQVYGMMLADNGAPWFVTGAPDERWDNDELRQLRRVRGSDFEAVDVSRLMRSPDSGRVR